ncbi:phosphoribosylanthranilate isomerase [Bacillus sp. REN3]|uniref:phosphoribosylanthranilate isomerase n=1 Tax=Bacillus sp. REN3 TaxID=2802440 RepID=UPI001AEDDD01|nr:phosphoribosylanthranilate isomerase [Bacillus sp. REN3]
MKVKICGIKSVDAAKCAVEAGADAIGFVFAPSTRRITNEQAKKIIKQLPGDVWKVGVFVDEEAKFIKEVADTVGLSHIQLHGKEDPDLYQEVGLPIIKSAAIKSKQDTDRLFSIRSPYLLLDSPPEAFMGGSGNSFDWMQVEGLGLKRSNIILAGGLTSKNVRAAIKAVRPFMVDVSSGVETDGEKDFRKIREFIMTAKKKEEVV